MNSYNYHSAGGGGGYPVLEFMELIYTATRSMQLHHYSKGFADFRIEYI